VHLCKKPFPDILLGSVSLFKINFNLEKCFLLISYFLKHTKRICVSTIGQVPTWQKTHIQDVLSIWIRLQFFKHHSLGQIMGKLWKFKLSNFLCVPYILCKWKCGWSAYIIQLRGCEWIESLLANQPEPWKNKSY